MTQVLTELQQSISSPDQIIRSEGNSPLHLAAYTGDVQLLLTLLIQGENVDTLNKNKETPLFLATRKGHAEVVNILLKHGASMSLHNVFGLAPIHIAATFYNSLILQMFIDTGRSPLELPTLTSEATALILAVSKKNSLNVEILLRARSNPNAVNNKGLSAITLAMQLNDFNAFAKLLFWGCDLPDIKTVNGITFKECWEKFAKLRPMTSPAKTLLFLNDRLPTLKELTALCIAQSFLKDKSLSSLPPEVQLFVSDGLPKKLSATPNWDAKDITNSQKGQQTIENREVHECSKPISSFKN